MLWQDVGGWSCVDSRYAALRDALFDKDGLLELVPDAVVEAIVECRCVVWTVLVASSWQHIEDEGKKVEIEM